MQTCENKQGFGAFGVLEKSPGICSGQRRDPSDGLSTSSGQTLVPPTTGWPGWGAWQLPDSSMSVPFPLLMPRCCLPPTLQGKMPRWLQCPTLGLAPPPTQAGRHFSLLDGVILSQVRGLLFKRRRKRRPVMSPKERLAGRLGEATVTCLSIGSKGAQRQMTCRDKVSRQQCHHPNARVHDLHGWSLPLQPSTSQGHCHLAVPHCRGCLGEGARVSGGRPRGDPVGGALAGRK